MVGPWPPAASVRSTPSSPGVLTRAVVWGWISHNPARLASPPSREHADTQPPAVEDAARLLRTAAAEDPELGLFPRPAVVLGARRGELCALRWSEVDLDQGEVLIAGAVVRVPHKALLAKPTKTHAKRRVAVGAGTVEQLRARRVAQAKDALALGTTLAADAHVFSHVPDGSKPLDPDGHMTLATYAHFQQAQDRRAAEFMDELLVAADTAAPNRRQPAPSFSSQAPRC
jgi:integrase